jgi:hypothetical protein
MQKVKDFIDNLDVLSILCLPKRAYLLLAGINNHLRPVM